jgi:hypothetical protein
MNGDHLERLLLAECGEDRRHASRQHRLAGARWSNEKDVVSPGSCYLERPFCRLLADDVREVRVIARPGQAPGPRVGWSKNSSA